MKIRNAVFIHLLMMSIIVVSACGSNNQKGVVHKTESSLKVLYHNEDSFQFEYGMLLGALYPHIDIHVIGTNTLYQDHHSEEEFDYEKALFKLIDREKPDLLMLQPELFRKLANENKLYNLDPEVTRSNFDLDGIAPNLLEYLREAGNGQLYGLANNFNSRALYYNKDLFDQYQIPYPTDQMNWEDLFYLAKRFPTGGEEDERIYGLRISESRNLFELATWIGYIEELSLINSAKQITIGSESWRKVFQQSLDAMRYGSLYAISGPAGAEASKSASSTSGEVKMMVLEVIDSDLFISGRVAMTLEYSSMINQINQAQQQSRNNESIIKNWDFVTIPVGNQATGRNPHMMMHNIFAIAADSPNKDAAWEVLSYITGDNYAKVKSKANLGGLSTRTAYLKDEEGRNYEAFYRLKPDDSFNLYGDYDRLPKNFIQQFSANARKELDRVINQEVSLEDALTDLEQWANMALFSE